ncbi:MAG: hypothetical protein ACYS6K_01500 [Planctomycetota bacterium]
MKQAIGGWSMQSDAVQKRNKPFECRVILLGALSTYRKIENDLRRPERQKGLGYWCWHRNRLSRSLFTKA